VERYAMSAGNLLGGVFKQGPWRSTATDITPRLTRSLLLPTDMHFGASGADHNLTVDQPAVGIAAFGLIERAAKGSNADPTHAAGTGGYARRYGGQGGDGDATHAGGVGGSDNLYAGKGGSDGGAGGGAGGAINIDAGAAVTGANGLINIGTTSTANLKTAAINLGNTTENPPVNVNSPLVVNKQVSESHTNVDATPYAVLPTDRECAVKTDVAREIDLEALATAGDGRVLIVSDRIGTASANPITVKPNGAEKINGVAASVVVDWNWGSIWLKADVSEGTWRIIGGW
jgi:hypothetical protein